MEFFAKLIKTIRHDYWVLAKDIRVFLVIIRAHLPSTRMIFWRFTWNLPLAATRKRLLSTQFPPPKKRRRCIHVAPCGHTRKFPPSIIPNSSHRTGFFHERGLQIFLHHFPFKLRTQKSHTHTRIHTKHPIRLFYLFFRILPHNFTLPIARPLK